MKVKLLGARTRARKEFVLDTLSWYFKNGRRFPWRDTTNPYKILVSELLLQRTRAEQVGPVYQKFVSKYPTPVALYRAAEGDIRKEIFSLGLQKRAPKIMDLGKELIEKHGGRIPRKRKSLEELPGVGPYTANAVLCFGFGERVPLVDPNVYLVYKTVFKMRSSKKRPQNDLKIWKFAERMLPESNFREYNYGLIDLGQHLRKKHFKSCSCPLSKKYSRK